MGTFDFLESYVSKLPDQERNDPYLGYLLYPGKSESEIHQLERDAGFLAPDELKEFYLFSSGALLGEYKILTISEISRLLAEMSHTYEEYWNNSILPFAYVRGVGDVIAFDLDKPDKSNLLPVLDGFHEVPPAQWKLICYGLQTWLTKMADNHFRPFWMG